MAPNPDNPAGPADRANPVNSDGARGAMSARDAARAVFGHTGVGMAVLTGTGTLLQANPALRQLLGLDTDAAADGSLSSLIHEDDRATVASALDELSSNADAAPVELDVRLAASGDTAVGATGGAHRNGDRWLRMSLSREPLEGTDPPGVIVAGIFVDITNKKRADLKAQTTHKRLEQLFEQANDIIFNIDLQGRFTRGNPVGARLVKRPLEKIIGMNFLDLVRPGYRKAAAQFYMRQITERIPSTYYEYPVLASDGEEIWLGQYVQLIIEDGKIANIQAVARNITDRKRTEDALRASEERVRAVVANAPIIVWAADPNGVLTFCDGHGLEPLGLKPADVMGQTLPTVYTDENGVTLEMELDRALAGETVQKEVSVRNRVFDSWSAPLRDAKNAIVGVMGVAVDITERVRLAERLRDAEKVEAIGRLAGGVAHDFNNQLTAILGFAEMLQQSFENEGDPRADDVLQILRGGRRAADLTEQLLAFGRKQPRRPQLLDLNDVVTDLEPLLLHSVREDMELDTVLAEGLRPVTADEVQIEQVIMNLTLNSRDAMPAGGRLTVRTANVTLDAAQLYDHPTLQPGPYTMVSVTDTGDGIDDDTKAHLFEPFFTTKDPGKGTGMGLASAYGIIRQSDGFIEVTSQVGHGSTFAVYLPSTQATLPARPPAAKTPTPAGGTETILFVEDNVAVREMTATALASAGYTVLQAQSAEEAFETSARHDGPIDLLLTDVVMPARNGRELADELTTGRPDLMVLYITAYPGDPTLAGALDATHDVLEKPFGPNDLLRRVRLLLDRADNRTAGTARQA
ncbi:MAG: PAS domain S-box protein [Vicinamibacterales bacterium]|jgi:PAS domain S-box-containing protein|nr:PAS domain S-box protein [Vicinamibacterales bacterium]